MRLSPRLEEIVTLVDPCNRVVDVGTDHALLPIALIKRDVVKSGLGVDKNRAPLVQARINRVNSDCCETLELLCSNGLSGVTLASDDLVVMAGMGGNTIQKILAETPWRGTMILQPNSGAPMLRKWLYEQGWSATVETLIQDKGQWYWTSHWVSETPTDKPSEMDIQCGINISRTSARPVVRWCGIELKRLRALPIAATSRELIPLIEQLLVKATNRVETI